MCIFNIAYNIQTILSEVLMVFLTPYLQKEFDRNLKSIPIADLEYPNSMVNIKEVLLAHYHIVDYFLNNDAENEKKVGGIGIKDTNMLCSALSRQAWCKNPKDCFEVCATVLYGLIQNHPFFDCNKRTAILTAFHLLHKQGRIPSVAHSLFEKLTINIATDNLSNYKRFKGLLKKENGKIQVIAAYLKSGTRAIEHDKPRITFRELRKILVRYNISLENPNKGYIDVYKAEEKTTFLGFGKSLKKTKLFRIGYQGENREVDAGALNRLRQKTSLTLGDGHDSATFYRGAESLPDLIEEYSGMLRSLADK